MEIIPATPEQIAEFKAAAAARYAELGVQPEHADVLFEAQLAKVAAELGIDVKDAGYEERGKRTGTGPYKGSFRRQVEGKKKGRRQEAGEECPAVKKEKMPKKASELVDKIASVIAEGLGRERKTK